MMLYGGRPGVYPPPGSRERLEMELERDKRERDAREREMRERELREIELMDKRRQELEMLPPGEFYFSSRMNLLYSQSFGFFREKKLICILHYLPF